MHNYYIYYLGKKNDSCLPLVLKSLGIVVAVIVVAGIVVAGIVIAGTLLLGCPVAQIPLPEAEGIGSGHRATPAAELAEATSDWRYEIYIRFV